MPERCGCLSAILRQRCPSCRRGAMFGGAEMHDSCPVCGLYFEREEGYFLGAMYFSYALAVLLLGAFYLIAMLVFPGWHSSLTALLALVAFIPFVPATFRYSRVLWIYFDRYFWPGEISSAWQEKIRQRQLAKREQDRL